MSRRIKEHKVAAMTADDVPVKAPQNRFCEKGWGAKFTETAVSRGCEHVRYICVEKSDARFEIN